MNFLKFLGELFLSFNHLIVLNQYPFNFKISIHSCSPPALPNLFLLIFAQLIAGHELRSSLLENAFKDEENKAAQESSIKKLIQRAPPASFFLTTAKDAKLHGSASNDIVLMAALKGNGRTTLSDPLRDEEIEEEKELIKEKKEEVLEEELETELEKEELLKEEGLDERAPTFVTELERERLDEEEVEAEREAVLLEESGYPVAEDYKYSGARRLIHAYVGEDGRMHYEPLSYAMAGQGMIGREMIGQGMIGQGLIGQGMIGREMVGQGMIGHHGYGNNHLVSMLSHCLPAKFHHLIEQCRDYPFNHHHQFAAI